MSTAQNLTERGSTLTYCLQTAKLLVQEEAGNREMSVEQLSKENLFTMGHFAHALQSIWAYNEIKESHTGDVWIIYSLSGA